MAKILVAVRRQRGKAAEVRGAKVVDGGRNLMYETSEEIAHKWVLLTKAQQMDLLNQAENNNEELPALLERLAKERRL